MEKKSPGAIDFNRLELLVLDVDGVLTDGGIILHSDGTESKRFDVQDGHRIRMWHRSGRKTAIISGRQTEVTDLRARQLEIDYVFQGCIQKLPAYETLLAQVGLQPSQTVCIGDDLMDIPLIRRAGFGVAVANAAAQVKQFADYVTTRCGGWGAVGECIEYILKQTGQWDELMKRYLV